MHRHGVSRVRREDGHDHHQIDAGGVRLDSGRVFHHSRFRRGMHRHGVYSVRLDGLDHLQIDAGGHHRHRHQEVR
jgi:hypothetical protein